MTGRVENICGFALRASMGAWIAAIAMLATVLALQADATAGDLVVVSFDPRPAGSVVLVDGELKCGRTPCTVSLKKGMHTVKTLAEGFLPDSRELDLVKDQTISVQLGPNFGWLVFADLAAGFELQVDGKVPGRIIRGRVQVPAGPHRVALGSPCHHQATAEVEVKRWEDTNIRLSPQIKEGAIDVSAEDEGGKPIAAEVYMDGVKAGAAPATFKVSTCTSLVEVRDGRHPDYRTEVKVFENGLTSVRAVLTGEQAPGNSGIGSEMVDIPAGGFWMGCNGAQDDQCTGDENPYIRAELHAFRIDKFETTAAEYQRCVQSGGCSPANTGPTCTYGAAGKQSHPINCVDWIQAKKYCKWAGKRLPTEAEWEKAARGPGGIKYPWGREPIECDHAVMGARGCKSEGTEPVGSKPTGASPYGVMDMIGNVQEWVADWYDEGYYGKSPGVDPEGPAKGSERVLRGGSWYSKLSMSLRASARSHNYPGLRLDLFGFRCAQ